MEMPENQSRGRLRSLPPKNYRMRRLNKTQALLQRAEPKGIGKKKKRSGVLHILCDAMDIHKAAETLMAIHDALKASDELGLGESSITVNLSGTEIGPAVEERQIAKMRSVIKQHPAKKACLITEEGSVTKAFPRVDTSKYWNTVL